VVGEWTGLHVGAGAKAGRHSFPAVISVRRLPALRWDPGRPALLFPRGQRSSTKRRSARRWSGSGAASTWVRGRRRDAIRSQRGSVLRRLPALCWDPGHLALLLPRAPRSSTNVRSARRWLGSGPASTGVRRRRRDALRSQRGSVLRRLPALCWDPGHLALLQHRERSPCPCPLRGRTRPHVSA
jgi:hypothetical protein